MLCTFNPIPHGEGGGEADSALLQIVFFITFVRDAAEPQNLVTSLKLMDNKVLNMEMTNFQLESRDMVVSAHAKKW